MSRHNEGQTPDLDAQQRTQSAHTGGQAGGQTGGVVTGTVRETDIGEGERVTKENLTESGINYLNAKRTYDEYQDAGLAAIKQNQRVFEQSAANLQSQLAQLNNITLQHLQNAVSNANLINSNVAEASNKTNNRAGRADDVATDNLWNPIQQGAADATLVRAISLDDASLKAIGAVVATALAEALAKKPE